MNDEENNVGAGATTENTGTTEVTETKKKTLDELLAEDKELQSQYDTKVTNSIKTAKTNWEKEAEAQKTEADKLAKMNKDQKLEYQLEKEKSEKDNALAELNAYKLKEEAIKIASEKGLDVSLLDLINFKTTTAEELNTSIENMTSVFNKAVEKAVNEKLKEDTPVTKTTSTIDKKTISRASY